MKARREFRDRSETQVAVLDALADRGEEGMTVFELRSRADVEIDDLEGALAELKEDDLIEASNEGERTVIVPDERVLATDASDTEQSLIDQLRSWLRS
jgi:predicted transcriptional regulator